MLRVHTKLQITVDTDMLHASLLLVVDLLVAIGHFFLTTCARVIVQTLLHLLIYSLPSHDKLGRFRRFGIIDRRTSVSNCIIGSTTRRSHKARLQNIQH